MSFKQVSFPGGHLEAGETNVEAAIREAEEELCGVDGDDAVGAAARGGGGAGGGGVSLVISYLLLQLFHSAISFG